LGLEDLHGACCPRTECTWLVGSEIEPKPSEPLLQVSDGFAGIVLSKRQEFFAWSSRRRTTHKPELCGTSIIFDIVGDASRRPVARRATQASPVLSEMRLELRHDL
jgi:hypothetical protein